MYVCYSKWTKIVALVIQKVSAIKTSLVIIIPQKLHTNKHSYIYSFKHTIVIKFNVIIIIIIIICNVFRYIALWLLLLLLCSYVYLIMADSNIYHGVRKT